MQTRVLDSGDASIAEAAGVLDSGGLVAIPTETVYGLAADAENSAAVAGIFDAKGRPSDQPLIVHIKAEWAHRYSSEWNDAASSLASAHWPGPVTLIVPKSDLVPDEVTGGLDSVGLRCPDHPVALALLHRFGRGVAAPSANRYGHVSPTTAQHVLDDLDGRIDAVLDAGPCTVGVESTIVEISADGSVAVLRIGAVTLADLEATLGSPVADGRFGPVRAPGMVLSHYAPAAPVTVLTIDELAREKLSTNDLVISHVPVHHDRSVVLVGDVGFAAGLYDALRMGDDPEVSRVLVVPPTSGPMAPAIADRLRRAAHTE